TINRPTTRRNDWEKARFEVSQQKWSDLTDKSQEYGISLLNRAKYGGDIHGHVMRLSLLRSPTWPDPMADRGKHRIEYSLYPHKGDWRSAKTMRKGYEYNYPLISKITEPHKGQLPKKHTFISIDVPNVILHAVKEAEPDQSPINSSGQPYEVWILRLFDSEGKATEATITLPAPIKKAVLSNFLEEEGKELSIAGDKVKVTIPANRVQTIKVWLFAGKARPLIN
ncbi:unnamed protein product, partial [marine sediment metagenome]